MSSQMPQGSNTRLLRNCKTPEKSPSSPFGMGVVSIAVGLGGTLIAFLFAYSLNYVEPGSMIRPMGLIGNIFLTSLLTLMLGVLYGIICLRMSPRRSRAWWLGLAGIAISCIAPVLISQLEINYIVAKNHLIMEE